MANSYKCSDGTRISKAQIDRNVRRAKEEVLQDQENEFGYNFCVECMKSGYPETYDDIELRIIDCSHIKSVNDCQREGKSELAWDKTNIRILCRKHHRLFDKTNLSFKKQTA